MKAPLLASTTFVGILGALAAWAASKADPNASVPERNSVEYPLNWNLDTLAGDYEKHGVRDSKWDSSAKLALTNVARIRALGNSLNAKEVLDATAAALKAAVSNGCADPMILYVHARYVVLEETENEGEYAKAVRAAAEALSQSGYSPVRKFYAALRAADAIKGSRTNMPPEVHLWRHKASQFLKEAVSDKAMPPREVYEACEELLKSVKNNPKQFGEYYFLLEPIIFANWPSDSSLYLLKGIFYTDFAWQARGAKVASKVTEQGWELFSERLKEAETALTKAWDLNSRDERIARAMLSVELGQGKGRQRMEQWFNRAVELNPNYYEAFYDKLYYLEPKWHGSEEDMLEFGRQCVNSKKWGGHVPLILRDAHESLARYLPKNQREDYWKRPEVWPDIKAAFEKFFTLNPGEIGWRHNYALYAYRAEQWDDLNRQIPLLGQINYDFFGGKAAYTTMVRLAKEHARR